MITVVVVIVQSGVIYLMRGCVAPAHKSLNRLHRKNVSFKQLQL